MSLRIIGIDPGSKESAFCVLDHNGTRARWIRHGTYPSDGLEILWPSLLSDELVNLVAIERPVWVHMERVFHGGPLLDTAWVGGSLLGIATLLRKDVVSLHARDWRGFLCGRQRGQHAGGQANDPMVKQRILAVCDDVPKRTANHHRDAAGVAFVAGIQELSRRRVA